MEEKYEWKVSPEKFVQIAHVEGCHWACILNKSSLTNIVDIFNSGPFNATPRVLAAVMKRQSFELRVINIATTAATRAR